MAQQPFDPNEFSQAFDPAEFEPKPAQSKVSPGFLESMASYIPEPVKAGWNWANEPLVDVSPYGKQAAEYITEPTLEDSESWWAPRMKGFVGGAAEGLTNVLSSLSSPLNLATMAATGGASGAARAGYGGAARGLAATGRALSVPVVGQGAGEVYGGLSEGDINRTLMGAATMAGGAAGVKQPTPKVKVKPSVRATAAAFADEVIPPPTKPVETLARQEPAVTPEIVPQGEGVGEVLSDGTVMNPEAARWNAQNAAIKQADAIKADELSLRKARGEQLTPEEEMNLAFQERFNKRETIDTEAIPELATDKTGDPEIDAILDKFKTGGADIEVVGEAAPGETPNASIESAASAEALSRQSSMKAKGETYVVFDQAGNKRPLIGPEAVDYTPGRGETYGIEKADGTFIKLEDNGGKVTATRQVKPQRREYPGFKGQASSAAENVSEPTLRQRLDEVTKNPAEAPKEASRIADDVEAIKNDTAIPEEEKAGLIRRGLAFNKALLTSWDLSAPGRQGKAFITNKAWWTSLDDMVRAWGSPEAANSINQSIIDHPSGYFKDSVDANGKVKPSLAKRIGLDLAESEEVFNSSKAGKAARKYLGVEKSSRAHTAFLNKLRSDQFVSFMEKAKKAGFDPESNINLAKSYADFINDATGRGSLNIGQWKLGRVTGVLNDVFFAPKNLSGQIRTWNNVLNPIRYAQHDPILRQQALRSLFAISGVGVGVSQLAKLGGAEVSMDPTNTDFMKMKFGDTRIDPFGGYQQFPVAAARFLLGQSTNPVSQKTTDLTAGKYGQSTRASIAERFFTNRLAPFPSFVWAWMNNREFDGKPFEWKRAIFERTLPIAQQDVIELAMEDPELAAIMAVPTTLGLTGTQTYTRD